MNRLHLLQFFTARKLLSSQKQKSNDIKNITALYIYTSTNGTFIVKISLSEVLASEITFTKLTFYYLKPFYAKLLLLTVSESELRIWGKSSRMMCSILFPLNDLLILSRCVIFFWVNTFSKMGIRFNNRVGFELLVLSKLRHTKLF